MCQWCQYRVLDFVFLSADGTFRSRRLWPVVLCYTILCVVAHTPHDVVDALAATRDGKSVWAMARTRLYRSNDGGLTWQLGHGAGLPADPLPGGAAHLDLSPQYDQDKTVYLLFNGTLFASYNAGLEWLTIQFPGRVRGFAISELSHKNTTLLLFGGRGLFRSVDMGRTFEEIRTTYVMLHMLSTTMRDRDVFFAVAKENRLIVSFDRGDYWRLAVDNPCDNEQIISLARSGNCHNGDGKASIFLLVACLKHLVCISCTATFSGGDVLTGSLVDIAFSQRRLMLSSKEHEVVNVAYGGVPPHFFYMSKTHLFAMTPASRKLAWTEMGFDTGLHFVPSQVKATGTYAYRHIAVCPLSQNTLFVGGYNGVFKSDHDLRVWLKLDIQMPLISGLQVVSLPALGKALLAACTYQVGCYTGVVNMDLIAHGTPEKALAHWSHVSTCARYSNLYFSPNFQNDGLALNVCQDRIRRMTWKTNSSKGKPTSTQVDSVIPSLHNRLQSMVHNVVFSPQFQKDETIFVAGFNIGIVASMDGGRTFQRRWDANGPVVGGSRVRIAISPHFQVDRVLVATVAIPPIPPGCSAADTMIVGTRGKAGVHCYASFFEIKQRGASIMLSRDAGHTWISASEKGPWQEASLLSNNKGGVFIVGIHGGQVWIKRNLMAPAHDWCTLEIAKAAKRNHPLVGYNGFAAHGSSAHILLGFFGGGTLLAEFANASCQVSKSSASVDPSIIEQQDSKTWLEPLAFVQGGLPGEDHLRGLGTLLTFSPMYVQDGIIFGASAFSILVSQNGGRSWSTILRLVQTQTLCSAGLGMANCALCRHAVEPVHVKEKHGSSGTKRFTDTGAYCLQCNPGHHRNSKSGTCANKRLLV